MQVFYDGAHSINFWDPKTDPVFNADHDPWQNTWELLKLIPSSRPVINPPPVKTSSIEVIGANSLIDLTEVPRGFPTFQNRTGSLEFYVDNSDPSYDWADAYNQAKLYFHGKRLRIYLTDDPASYYEGRFSVNSWKSDKNISKITLDYDLDPFALAMFSTLEEWLWDPFDFLNMNIPNARQEDFRNLSVPAGETEAHVAYGADIIGAMPVCPTFYVTDSDASGMTVTVYNSYNQKWSNSVTVYNTGAEGFQDPLITLSTPSPGSETFIYFSGAGKLSIDFRPGRL